jgi:hypothetical protein
MWQVTTSTLEAHNASCLTSSLMMEAVWASGATSYKHTISSYLNKTTMFYLNVLISSLMIQGHLTRYSWRLIKCLLFTQNTNSLQKQSATDNNSVSWLTPSSRLPHMGLRNPSQPLRAAHSRSERCSHQPDRPSRRMACRGCLQSYAIMVDQLTLLLFNFGGTELKISGRRPFIHIKPLIILVA